MDGMTSPVNVFEVIRHRRSIRTFDGKPLAANDADRILEFASKTENPFDITIEWKLLDAKKEGLSSPVIAGADTYIAGKMQRVPHAEEAFGYTFEKIVLFAESLGIGTTWIAGTMDRRAFERVMNVSEDEVMPCISPLGYPAAKMSFRETIMRKGVGADTRLAFEKLFFDGSFDQPLTAESAGSLARPLEAVRLAPSAVNKQPWRVVISGGRAHFYKKQSMKADGGSWDVQKIDMGIALSHFELTAAECGIGTAFLIEDPEIPHAEGVVYIASFLLAE
jgi:nitroreductase